VTIHRRDCPNVLRVAGERTARLLAASWGADAAHFVCDIAVEAFDRHGLLRDISDIFAKEHMPLVRVNTDTHDGMANMHFHVQHNNAQQLERALARIAGLSNVVNAVRVN